MQGGERRFFRHEGAPGKRHVSRRAAREGLDRAIAALAEHGHAHALAYPYSIFVQALKLHEKDKSNGR